MSAYDHPAVRAALARLIKQQQDEAWQRLIDRGQAVPLDDPISVAQILGEMEAQR